MDLITLQNSGQYFMFSWIYTLTGDFVIKVQYICEMIMDL